MSDDWIFAFTLLTALGCGLMAGVFFAFASFVMAALARLPPLQGIAAMQSINVVAVTPLFMTALFGTAAACVALAIIALSSWGEAGAAYLLGGAVLYILGAPGVTMAFNVPRNNALAAVDPAGADGAGLWAGYVAGWTAWNHVRVVASLAALAALIMALCARW